MPYQRVTNRLRTSAGGYAMTDEQYNRGWFARLMRRSVFTEKGCFVWQGPVTAKGYIMHAHRTWRTQGHRIVYMLSHKVELVTEQFVCHSCDERRCWNPAHLWVGSNGDNQRDAGSKGRHQESKKTYCPQGHEYTPENTRVHESKPGIFSRSCKTCERVRFKSERYMSWRREYQRRRRAAKRAVREASA